MPPCGEEAGGMTDSVTDTADDGIRLHRLLGGEHTAWLVRRARDRLDAASAWAAAFAPLDDAVAGRPELAA